MEKKEWYKSLPVLLCLIGLLTVIGIFFYLLTRVTLSVSDTILLTFIGILISAGVSYYFGRYSSYEEARKRIAGEATKALRRIVCIKDSADRLKSNTDRIINLIMSKCEEKDEQEVLLEYFRGIHSQLLDLIGNIGYSIEDWADIVPKEVKEIKEIEKKGLEIYEEKLKERDKIIEQYANKLEKSKGKERKQLKKEVDKEIQKLRSEYDREIAKIRAAASGSTIPFPSLSAPADSSGLRMFPSQVFRSGKAIEFTLDGKKITGRERLILNNLGGFKLVESEASKDEEENK